MLNVECGLRSWLFPKGGKAIGCPSGNEELSNVELSSLLTCVSCCLLSTSPRPSEGKPLPSLSKGRGLTNLLSATCFSADGTPFPTGKGRGWAAGWAACWAAGWEVKRPSSRNSRSLLVVVKKTRVMSFAPLSYSTPKRSLAQRKQYS